MPSISEKIEAGRPEFVFVGEHPAIDFANTLLMLDGQERDLLPTWADAVEWLSESGLSADPCLELPAARGAEALKHLLELRRSWKVELARLVSGGKIGDEFLERLNRHLADDTFHEKLRREAKKGFYLFRSSSRLYGIRLALAILGRQIAVFLVEANLSYLHRCANTTSCVLFFYDTTKNHRRQWCSVAGCGNRHKVAQFRKRQMKADG
jgi:predicted RNA-binding Zn ribbon-like protein